MKLRCGKNHQWIAYYILTHEEVESTFKNLWKLGKKTPCVDEAQIKRENA
jgi:hypothetical protein